MKSLRLKFTLLVIFCAMGATHSIAQTKRSLGLGVRAGVNLADYTNSKGEHLTGFTGGVYTDLYFTNHLAMEIGGYYSRQGCENIYIPEDYKSGRIDNQLDYGQLQFGLKFNIVGGFRIQGMMDVDFLLKAQTTLRPNGVTDPSQYTVLNNFYNANPMTLNVMAAVGYRFKFGLDLMAGYIGGLTPIFKDADNKTSMFRITLGWRIIGAKLKNN